MTEDSDVLPPEAQAQVAEALEDDAQLMSNRQLEQQLAGQPPAIQDEIIRINTDARPLALQVALLVPLLAGLVGFLRSLRMLRIPEPEPVEALAPIDERDAVAAAAEPEPVAGVLAEAVAAAAVVGGEPALQPESNAVRRRVVHELAE